MLLIPELLIEPLGEGAEGEVQALVALLARLELRPTDEATAELATSLGATYGLCAVDAIHLATAVAAGPDRFTTNRSSDFVRSIDEIGVTYLRDLPDPEARRGQARLRNTPVMDYETVAALHLPHLAHHDGPEVSTSVSRR